LPGRDVTLLGRPEQVEAQQVGPAASRRGVREGVGNSAGRVDLAVEADSGWPESMGGVQE
jgi:hypothetical protein